MCRDDRRDKPTVLLKRLRVSDLDIGDQIRTHVDP